MPSTSSSSARILRCSGASLRQAWTKADSRPAVTTTYNALFSRRSMATEAALPSSAIKDGEAHIKIYQNRPPPPKTNRQMLLEPSPVTATIYTFPELEPVKFKQYNPQFLHLPLRRDILHRAIVHEGRAHRLGRAKTQWRSEVKTSGHKLRPQKGSGKARLGDASSPMLRGGAKAHGPKPRDFRTALPKKVYDLAFRTALSHRYRKGELVIIGGTIKPEHSKTRYMRQILLLNKWGKGDGKTLFITMSERHNLFCGLSMLGHHGRAMAVEDVDVKDLLEMGRIVIEEHALEWIGEQHGITFGRPLRTVHKPSRLIRGLPSKEMRSPAGFLVESLAEASSEEAEQASAVTTSEMVDELTEDLSSTSIGLSESDASVASAKSEADIASPESATKNSTTPPV